MKKSSQKVILQDVRCSYVCLSRTNKHGKYSLQPLIPKDSDNYKKIMSAQKKVLIDAFGADAWERKGKFKLPVRDGDADLFNGGEPREGDEYRDVVFLNANNAQLPGIVNRANEPADEQDLAELAYSGAYMHVSITLYAYSSTDGGKDGIGAGLNNVMLRKKGDRLDGSVSATSEFSEFADSELDDFDDDF